MTTTATKERPILFSGPMVLALLDGRKTQTRRPVKLKDLDDLPHVEYAADGMPIWFQSEESAKRLGPPAPLQGRHHD